MDLAPEDCDMLTHLGWSSGIGLGLGSMLLLLKVSGSILAGANLRGLV